MCIWNPSRVEHTELHDPLLTESHIKQSHLNLTVLWSELSEVILTICVFTDFNVDI